MSPKVFVLVLWALMPNGEEHAFVIDEDQSASDCARVLDAYETAEDGSLVSWRGAYRLACEPQDAWDAAEREALGGEG